MLDIEMLKAMPPQTIFATGIIKDNPEGLNITNSGDDLRWVAVRGRIHDWTIYVHRATNTIQQVATNGDKVLFEENIRGLVPCDDESYEMYRD